MSSLKQATQSTRSAQSTDPVVVTARAKGNRIYVGSGLTSDGIVEFKSDAGATVVFAAKYPPLEHQDRARVKRKLKVSPDLATTCLVRPTHQKKNKEKHYHFYIIPKEKHLPLLFRRYRLAILPESSTSSVKKVTFNLDTPVTQYVHCTASANQSILEIRGESGVNAMKPSWIQAPQSSKKTLSSENVHGQFSVIIHFDLKSIDNKKPVASISELFAAGAVSASELVVYDKVKPQCLESGGTEQVDIYIDP
jgi:hypothetical protein